MSQLLASLPNIKSASTLNPEGLPSGLAAEIADLKNQLSTQDKLVIALERRVSRSLGLIQAHLERLDQSFCDRPDWQKTWR